MNEYVGSNILSIITESLYDDPIVVFREYVQNAVDSINLLDDTSESKIIIDKIDENNLLFIDNGCGIDKEKFEDKMLHIANSDKSRLRNLGYKGIGRLSGVPYCERLYFINIVDRMKEEFQIFWIDGQKYLENKNSDLYKSMSFEAVMDEISNFDSISNFPNFEIINKYIKEMEGNTGFVVYMSGISQVLKTKTSSIGFGQELSWLLPVPFMDEVLKSEEYGDSFNQLIIPTENSEGIKSYTIVWNGEQLYRPIGVSNLRKHVVITDMGYATCLHSFSSRKIAIDNSNPFSGIRVYIDNMLLCDEREIVQNLDHFGLLNRSTNGMIQTLRGIGAVIYITDKESIAANARRTFFEVTDNDSIDFLEKIGLFADAVYDTRYALSNYASALKNEADGIEIDVEMKKKEALACLNRLAQQEMELAEEKISEEVFASMSVSEKKREIKKSISRKVNAELKQYIKSLTKLDYSNSYIEFIEWCMNNNKLD